MITDTICNHIQLHDDTDKTTTNNNIRTDTTTLANASKAWGTTRPVEHLTAGGSTLQREPPPFKGVPRSRALLRCEPLWAAVFAAGNEGRRWRWRRRRMRKRRGGGVGSTTCVFLFVCVLLPCSFGRGGVDCFTGASSVLPAACFSQGRGSRGRGWERGSRTTDSTPVSSGGVWLEGGRRRRRKGKKENAHTHTHVGRCPRRRGPCGQSQGVTG